MVERGIEGGRGRKSGIQREMEGENYRDRYIEGETGKKGERKTEKRAMKRIRREDREGTTGGRHTR